MSYEKRVCVLKQVKKGFTADGSALSGAIYAERMGDELTVVPRLLGIAPVKDGRYALALWIEGGIFVTELGNGAPVRLQTPSIKAGLAALLVYVRGTAEPIAFGSCGVAPSDYAPLLSAVEKGEKKRVVPNPLPPNELPYSPNNVPLAPTVPLPGEEDPPEEEEEERESESVRPGRTGDAPSFRQEASSAKGYDDEAIAEIDYFRTAADGNGKAAGGAEEAAADGSEPEKDDGARHPIYRSRGALTYYISVRDKLAAAFAKFPKDDRLTAAFPCSEWVKTDAALLGVLYESGMPRYLCVAVEGRADGEPPQEMKGHCRFVPESPVSDMVGFFVVFQSADTGEYVTVYDS